MIRLTNSMCDVAGSLRYNRMPRNKSNSHNMIHCKMTHTKVLIINVSAPLMKQSYHNVSPLDTTWSLSLLMSGVVEVERPPEFCSSMLYRFLPSNVALDYVATLGMKAADFFMASVLKRPAPSIAATCYRRIQVITP